MKYVKMLGLATAAVAALMAFGGASSASAAVLCKVEGTGSPTGTTCPAGSAYPAGTVIHGVNTGTVKMDTAFKTVECSGSTVQGATEQEGSATESITGSVSSLTFTGCNCTVTVGATGTLHLSWVSVFTGTWVSFEMTITVNCSTIFGNVHCAYVTDGASLGDLQGGTTAILLWVATLHRENTSALCDEEATLTARYEITSPKPLYVTGHT